ncbi:uncharacterized protein V6R79_025055 [Siganus canaliculatus]
MVGRCHTVKVSAVTDGLNGISHRMVSGFLQINLKKDSHAVTTMQLQLIWFPTLKAAEQMDAKSRSCVHHHLLLCCSALCWSLTHTACTRIGIQMKDLQSTATN